jgi:hypothetical protein
VFYWTLILGIVLLALILSVLVFWPWRLWSDDE